ncbi:MAG: FAD-binding oxidoreductase [Proteobacteria bacterium]|nr:MAG: FAD-binding oxidoreductase [Pseudomonadota bacterium]QKK11777.1 MAG: FAD-binding oxidoreductase [Pseudomonadota bacterium]
MNAPLETLRSLLGPKGLIPGSEAAGYTTDIAGRTAPCLAVLRPASTQEVSDAVRICAEHDLAIIPQGGNTNLCQMTVPESGRDSVILNLSRMNHILEVDPACSTITAESGCTIQALQEAAAEQDRLFAPDWGARGTAQIGGAVATNGGGLNVFRYGTTREQVLGMEVVLPDGQVWDGMRSLRKDNSGYDLKQLFIGAEGTLGIITKLVFKLHPLQPFTQSMMAVLADISRLTDYLNLAQSLAGGKLVAVELLNGIGMEKALERYPDLHRPLDTKADWYVLIRLAGASPVEETLTAIYEQGFKGGMLEDAVMAQSVAQERNIWEIREQMIPMQYFKGHQVKWDVSVPVSRIVDFLRAAEAIAAKHQKEAITYAVGHVGDGNIHYSIFPKGEAGPEMDRLNAIYTQEIDALIWSFGGSIVAEHGVGSVYMDRMRRQKSAVEYQMMQKLRALFDPQGIMNPGKLIRRNPDN